MDEPTRRVGEAGEGRRTQPRETSAASTRTTKNNRPARSENTELDAETETRTRVIREEIADTRAELSETVDAIQEKLRPSNIVSESTEAIKNAVTERVGVMADSASQTAQDFIENTRQNPMPALMIGAGVAWLLYDRTRDTSRSGRRDHVRRTTQDSIRTRSAYEDEGTRPGYGAMGRERSRPTSYRTSYSGSYDANPPLHRMSRDVQTSVQRMLHKNPLLVAAAAVLAGAAIGGALPQTEQENELMGEARDQFVDRGREAARDAVESVREVAEAVQNVASQVTNSQ